MLLAAEMNACIGCVEGKDTLLDAEMNARTGCVKVEDMLLGAEMNYCSRYEE